MGFTVGFRVEAHGHSKTSSGFPMTVWFLVGNGVPLRVRLRATISKGYYKGYTIGV